MGYLFNDYVGRIIVEERARQFIREAEVDRLLGEAYPHRPSVVSRTVRNRLHDLGHLLVAVGERLQRLEASHAASWQEECTFVRL
jgi:hypothetical protein